MNKMEEIIRVSSKIFSERGFDKASMRDIAKATNLTTAGLYYYIGSKEKLLSCVEDFLIKEFGEKILLKVDDNKYPFKRIKQLMENLVNTLLDNKEIISILLEKAVSRSEFSKESRARRKRLIVATEELIKQLKKEGNVNKDVDVTIVTYCLVGMVTFLPQWFKPKGRLNREELINSISKFFCYGLLKGANRKEKGISLP